MYLSRRRLLRGAGAAVGLPLLDAMLPSVRGQQQQARVRMVCVETVHGAAGSSQIGSRLNLWAPERTGAEFTLTAGSLRSLEPLKPWLTVVSGLDCPSAEPETAREIGGDHVRSSAAFLTQSHPKQTEGSDFEAGISLDQVYANHCRSETPVPSIQLCIEPPGTAACDYGYSCVYTDCLSWAAPRKPLPGIRDPRVAFDSLFRVSGGNATDRSILDWILEDASRLRLDLGRSDRARLDDYLENVREIERRIQVVERRRALGDLAEVPPNTPPSVPESFSEHVRLLFDLQFLAFASDTTRVASFKLGRDNSNRVYPESGSREPFHFASHHSGRESKIREFAKINAFHVSLLAEFLAKMAQTRDGAASLLDNSVVLYGSAMGDSNQHNHRDIPFLLAGHAGGRLKGGRHIRAKRGTSAADAMLSVLRAVGVEADSFGDSEAALDLNAA